MSETQPTVIAAHTVVKGGFHIAGAAVIAGRVEGGIVSEDALDVMPEGVVEGDIQGVLVDIQGTVKGNVTATRACRLGPTSRVNGEIRATNLAFSDGACFVGQVFVGGGEETEGTQDLQEEPEEEISKAQAVAGSINRLQALTHDVEEVGAMAASAASGKAESVPPVRVLSQTVQQTLHRSPKIIKAR